MKEQEKNIKLAKYWINKITDNWRDELSLSDDYKKYYIPLKSFLINQQGKYNEPNMEDKIALEFEVPHKYYNIDYKKLVTEKFNGLFKIIESIESSYDIDGIYIASSKYRYLYSEKRLIYVKSEAEKYKILEVVPSPITFANDYIEQSRFKKRSVWFNSMEQFLSYITPKPISANIEKLLEQINKDNLNNFYKYKQMKVTVIDANEYLPPSFPFPYPIFTYKNLSWKDIHFEIVSDDSVRIAIAKRQFSKRFTYSELDFKDNRIGDKANKLWDILVGLGGTNGIIDELYFLDRKIIEKNVSRLRIHLIKLIGVGSDPIPFNRKNKSYKTKFSIIDKRPHRSKFSIEEIKSNLTGKSDAYEEPDY